MNFQIKIIQEFDSERGVFASRLTVKELQSALQMNVTCVANRVPPFPANETFKTIQISVVGLFLFLLFQIHS